MDAATMMAHAIAETQWEHNAYRPLPLHLGEPCEKCWFDGVDLNGAGWKDYNRLIRTPRYRCPHGGAS